MKLSGYEQSQNNNVVLKLDYNDLDSFDKVYISKVFTDTNVPEEVLTKPNIAFGGTGFFYDKAPSLPDYIEHHMPDYHLYGEWVQDKINNGSNKTEFKEYLDYSIGFLTRGCFRKCEFCVNKKYNHVFLNSPLDEFYDPTKKKICLLDDNFFGFSGWKEQLLKLQSTGKPFKFKQGMDERILNDEKCELLFSSKYDGDYTFAFDNIEDAEIIKSKLQLIRKHTNIIPKFYVLCGFDHNDKYDKSFWVQDIVDTFERIKILSEYKCLPYIMRFNKYEESLYKGMYITLARWCNQPSIFKKKSFREYCEMNQEYSQIKNGLCSSMRYLTEFEKEHPDIAEKYFDLKFSNY